MSSIFHTFYYRLRDSFAARVNYRLKYDTRSMSLIDSTLHSSCSGVSAEERDKEIIVSLTTHGKRLHDVCIAIESIMQGSVLPNRIVLWLSDAIQQEPLPVALQNQCRRGLEIRYTQDIGPYTKLIPTLTAYPDATIVTIDDDIIYPYDMLEMLLNAHRMYPNQICANRIIEARYLSNGKLASFIDWHPMTNRKCIARTNFFEGLGGVLYPVGCFPKEVFNREVFLAICPTADDIWFNAMAMLQGTLTVYANTHYTHLPLLVNEEVQDIGLWQTNNAQKGRQHNQQLNAVLSHYSLSYHSIDRE